MKNTTKNYLIIGVLILCSAGLLMTFSSPGFLKALIYPVHIQESEMQGENVLVVKSFLDGKEEEGASISQEEYEDLTSQPSSGMGGSTSYEKRKAADIKNIVLKASQNHAEGYFVGWSGCDAENPDKRECQISVTDNQTRKIEAHYMGRPEKLPLQIFSISENPLGGELNNSWINTRPELAYKAAYIDVGGQIPETIGYLSVADELQLNLGGNEKVKGPIPTSTGQLGSIDYLGLYKMSLENKIPKELGNLSPLYFLAYKNQLEKEIPKQLGNMGAQPVRFELHENQLEGEVPKKLSNISGLQPSEMRFYVNKLESTEDELIEKSDWQGINFNTNKFPTPSAMDTLADAAKRSGTYIDFCNNPAIGGKVNYNIKGKCTNVDIYDEVNAAVKKGWDVYIKIELYQDYEWWEGCSSAKCVCKEGEDGGEVCSPAGCNRQDNSGLKPYCKGHAICVRITDPIKSCEDIPPNSVGLPKEVIHASNCPGCDYWKHPECTPVCDIQGSCPGVSCKETYPFSGRDSIAPFTETPFRSTGCYDVKKLYNPDNPSAPSQPGKCN